MTLRFTDNCKATYSGTQLTVVAEVDNTYAVPFNVRVAAVFKGESYEAPTAIIGPGSTAKFKITGIPFDPELDKDITLVELELSREISPGVWELDVGITWLITKATSALPFLLGGCALATIAVVAYKRRK